MFAFAIILIVPNVIVSQINKDLEFAYPLNMNGMLVEEVEPDKLLQQIMKQVLGTIPSSSISGIPGGIDTSFDDIIGETGAAGDVNVDIEISNSPQETDAVPSQPFLNWLNNNKTPPKPKASSSAETLGNKSSKLKRKEQEETETQKLMKLEEERNASLQALLVEQERHNELMEGYLKDLKKEMVEIKQLVSK